MGGWGEWVHLSYQKEVDPGDGYAGAARRLIRPWNETRVSLTARLRRRLARERGGLGPKIRDEAELLARWVGLLEDGEEPVAAGLGLREIYRSLEARSWRGLGCLVIDDAQWAQEQGDGLSIAEALVHDGEEGDLERKPLLVIVTVRSEDLFTDSAMAERVDALIGLGAHRLDLPRLDRRGTEALLEASLTLVPALREKVAHHCEGNPLFARQLLLEWVERGWLVDQGGLRYGLVPDVDPDDAMPRDAVALYTERVAAVCEASEAPSRFRDLLDTSALAGASLPAGLLENLAGSGLYDFATACGIWTSRDHRMHFASARLHQAILAEARQRRDRVALHRKLGRAWARYGQQRGEDVDFEVGRHAHAGRDWSFAMAHIFPAAATAWARGQGRALELLSELADATVTKNAPRLDRHRGAASLWRARALEVRGEVQQATGKYREAFQAYVRSGDQEGALAAIQGTGLAELQNGKLELADALCTEAVSRARDLDDQRAEAHAIAAKAQVEQQKRNFSGAELLLMRVLNRLEQLDDPVGAGQAILGLALLARRTGRFQDALELYEDGTEAFRSADDPMGVGRAMLGGAVTRLQLRDYDEADRLFREGIAVAEEVGATRIVMEGRLGLCSLHRHRNELDRARSGYQECLRWAIRTESFEAEIFAHLGVAMLALEADDLPAAHAAASDVVVQLNRVPGHWLWAAYRLIVAAMMARRGRQRDTWEWLWSAKEIGLGDTVDRDQGRCLEVICEEAYERGWPRVLRVSSQLGVVQLEALGLLDGAARLREKLQSLPS